MCQIAIVNELCTELNFRALYLVRVTIVQQMVAAATCLLL